MITPPTVPGHRGQEPARAWAHSTDRIHVVVIDRVRALMTERAGLWKGATLDLLFAVYLLAIGILRLSVISSFPEPSGLDGGNWLAFGNALFGAHFRSASVVYPPLIPLITIAFAKVWGPLRGIEILAAVVSLAPAAGIYLPLRRHLGVRAVLLAGLLAPAATTGEAAAWGGYPQLLGLGLLGAVLWALDRFTHTHSLKWAGAASVLIFLTLLTSDLIGVATVVIAIVFVIIRLVMFSDSERPSGKRLAVAVLIGAAPSITLTPIYAALAAGVLGNQVNKGAYQLTFSTLLPTLDNLLKDNVDLWHLLLVVALLSPIALVFRRARPVNQEAAATLATTIAMLFALRDDRLFFLLPIGVVLGAGSWWMLLTDPRRPLMWWTTMPHLRPPLFLTFDNVLVTTAAAILVLQSALGISTFQSQVGFYSTLTPGIVSGLEMLDRVAPHEATLAVGPAPRNGWPFGWWVEGLLNRPTVYASNLRWLNFPDERRRASLANEMFSARVGIDGAIVLAKTNGISYIVVASEWPGYRVWLSNGRPLATSMVLVSNESILIISTSG